MGEEMKKSKMDRLEKSECEAYLSHEVLKASFAMSRSPLFGFDEEILGSMAPIGSGDWRDWGEKLEEFGISVH